MNPYTPKLGQLFYGRERVLRDLLRDEATGQSVVLVAGRRCGKTRLMERLCTALRDLGTGRDPEAWKRVVPDSAEPCPRAPAPPVHWPVLFDAQGQEFDGLRGFVTRLAGEISSSLPEGLDVPTVAQGVQLSLQEFEAWLLKVDKVLHEASIGGLALIVDEIETVFQLPWCHNLMAFLRRLDDHVLKTRLWLVLAGSDALDRYRHPDDGSPPLNTTRRAMIRDLDYRSRRRMAIEPFARTGRAPLSDALLAKIDDVAAGNPWILTNALEALWEIDRPGEADVERFQENFLADHSDLLMRWAKPLGEAGWNLYRDVVSSGQLGVAQLRTDAQRQAGLLLEYQALVHRRSDGTFELGPALFRHWAVGEQKIGQPYSGRPRPEPEFQALPPGQYEFDVALSYAGPQRALAEEIYQLLARQNMRVFYDQRLTQDLWGVDLARSLPHVYDRAARLSVLLVSQEYAQRAWPLVESRAAVVKAVREGCASVLMASTDGTRLEHVPPSIVDFRAKPGTSLPEHITLEILARLGSKRGPF